MHTLTISIGVHRMYSHWTLPTDVSIDIGKHVFLYLPPYKLTQMENQQGWANTYHSSSPCFNKSPHSAYWPQLMNQQMKWVANQYMPCYSYFSEPTMLYAAYRSNHNRWLYQGLYIAPSLWETRSMYPTAGVWDVSSMLKTHCNSSVSVYDGTIHSN